MVIGNKRFSDLIQRPVPIPKYDGLETPFAVNINQMCAFMNHPEYAKPIERRIVNDVRCNEENKMYVFNDYRFINDIFLSAEGFEAFHNILSSYFDDKDLYTMVDSIKAKNQISSADQKVEGLLKRLSIAQLKEIQRAYRQKERAYGIQIDYSTYCLISAELIARNPIMKRLHLRQHPVKVLHSNRHLK